MTDLLAVLQDFYRERLTMLLAHGAGARFARQYDVNNTYQYIINRDEVQLSWIADAIGALGGTLPEVTEPVRTAPAGVAPILEQDARDSQAFVDRWRPRITAMRNARQAKMLNLILGEVLEQKRFFEQALAGRTDLLGRRGDQLGPSHGEVLSARWIE